jgi:hypothetical protein
MLCDLNHCLAISEASVGRSSACKSCKSEVRQGAASDVWSIGWPAAQSRKHPLTDWNLNPQDCCFYKDFRNLRLAIVGKKRLEPVRGCQTCRLPAMSASTQ